MQMILLLCFSRTWQTNGIVSLEYEKLDSDSYKLTCESSHLTSFTAIVDIIEVCKDMTQS